MVKKKKLRKICSLYQANEAPEDRTLVPGKNRLIVQRGRVHEIGQEDGKNREYGEEGEGVMGDGEGDVGGGMNGLHEQ